MEIERKWLVEDWPETDLPVMGQDDVAEIGDLF